MSEERTKEEIKEAVVEVLKSIFDPEIPVNIYELGLVYESGVSDAVVELVFEPAWNQDMMSEEAKLELGFM